MEGGGGGGVAIVGGRGCARRCHLAVGFAEEGDSGDVGGELLSCRGAFDGEKETAGR
jgi:hypothetical protein